MPGQVKPGFYAAVGAVVVVLVGFAIWRFTRTDTPPGPKGGPPGKHVAGNGGSGKPAPAGKDLDPKMKEKLVAGEELPNLGPAGAYKPRGDTIDVEISEWPGYAALIWANGGLEPNTDSHFFKKHGFKLKIAVSEAEAEGWVRLNSGKTAASVTTVDVLALYANQLKVEVPLQFDFSRGGDGILTLKDIKTINQLKGKRVTVAQHTEAEFFLRFLGQEAGLGMKALSGLDTPLDPERVNLLYTRTAEDAAEVFASSVKNGDGLISGAVTWSPYTVELPQELPDQVRLLVSNRNLLVVADILLVNAGFAKENPKTVQGLVEGILTGVEEIRKDPDRTLPVVAKAFNKKLDEMKELMADVHLSNHAENALFFSPDPNQTGSLGDIYYTALYAYGKDTKNAIAPQKMVNRTYLDALAKDPRFQEQKVLLGPVSRSDKDKTGAILEVDPVLVKQIRFHFQPNSSELDLMDAANQQSLKDLDRLMKRAPGSYFVLRGHLDNSRVEEFKQQGEAFYRRMAVRAVAQSEERAKSVRNVLLKTHNVEAKRIDTEGRGWDEPLPSARAEENRRVEVRFFQLE